MAEIIDSHIHLWPRSAANSQTYAWMDAAPSFLAVEHEVLEYLKATQGRGGEESRPTLQLIYVETDRRYRYNPAQGIEQWAVGPLEEIKFLRSIVEGRTDHARMLAGIVLWAPVDRGEAVFDRWLELAETVAGPATWTLVKGFRFLLQGIQSQSEFEQLVLSDGFIRIMTKLGSKGYAFDVGIDQHSGGLWQLQIWSTVLDRTAEASHGQQTTFVMNHLCKPNMTKSSGSLDFDTNAFHGWQECIRKFASFPNVYMKLSGGFSEMADTKVNTTQVEALASRIQPWTNTVFDAFAPDRIMFGSDWPVCNIRGPAPDRAWCTWLDIVRHICTQRKLTQIQSGWIFVDTAKRVYRLESSDSEAKS